MEVEFQDGKICGDYLEEGVQSEGTVTTTTVIPAEDKASPSLVVEIGDNQTMDCSDIDDGDTKGLQNAVHKGIYLGYIKMTLQSL